MDNTNNKDNGNRFRIIIIATIVFLLVGGAYFFYWFSIGRFTQKTDNAYVAGNIVQITPLTFGMVQSVEVNDTEFVEKGAVLVRLDRADAEIALRQAEAQLAQTVRQVRRLYTDDGSLNSIVRQKTTELDRAEKDLARRLKLAGTGAISDEEIYHAENTVKGAKRALETAIEQMRSNRNLIDNIDAENHPEVLKAAARVSELYLALKRTEITAPVSGYIAKRNVQAGQWVKVGEPLMALVPLDQVWVDANFKETQLRNMRVGQPVELKSDMLGKSVVYHGVIEGFSAGTGSVFSLIPAQNATGNWIKVVQRLAVRIALDKDQLAKNPLQIGLSMEAAVNIKDTGGSRLAAPKDIKNADEDSKTGLTDAEQLINGIIEANIGKR